MNRFSTGYKRRWICETVLLLLIVMMTQVADAQHTDSLQLKDSLQEVKVQAFLSDNTWKDVPAAISLISTKQVEQISTTTLLPAVNAIPGVRMEERSPESYRLSIRGSTLRSPFGVRDVKVYWNDIPLTDAAGNTYLNLVDVSQVTSAEIIKGPSASMYGAGTGGVLLLQSLQPFSPIPSNAYHSTLLGGSYNLINEQSNWTHQQSNFSSILQQAHIQCDGYRQQSASRRDDIKWDGQYHWNDQQFKWVLFYADQYYQTPGGLTKAQMLADPQSARPPAGTTPGAVQQQAAIYNKTLYSGLNHSYTISPTLSTTTSLMLNHTSFTNPAILDYENRDETNTAFRTALIWQTHIAKASLQWINGGEWVYNHSRIDDYGNNKGVKDTVQIKSDLYANQWFAFSQAQLSLAGFTLNAGISLNTNSMHYDPIFTNTAINNQDNIHNRNVPAPRVSLLYKITGTVNYYALLSRGFSTPALAEVFPQDKTFHSNLQPEYGWNYENGIKGDLFHHVLQFDAAIYDFELKNAIVMRNNPQGLQYFVNAGNISEKGIELWVRWHIIKQQSGWIRSLYIWSSYAYQPYYFGTYIQGTANYSGHAVTGVPRNNEVTGIELENRSHDFLNIQYGATAALPLNDANDEYAAAYHLLQAKLGKQFHTGKCTIQVFIGGDNLLNENYSLGDDINAAARRFYNPAAKRNFYTGISMKF